MKSIYKVDAVAYSSGKVIDITSEVVAKSDEKVKEA